MPTRHKLDLASVGLDADADTGLGLGLGVGIGVGVGVGVGVGGVMESRNFEHPPPSRPAYLATKSQSSQGRPRHWASRVYRSRPDYVDALMLDVYILKLFKASNCQENIPSCL